MTSQLLTLRVHQQGGSMIVELRRRCFNLFVGKPTQVIHGRGPLRMCLSMYIPSSLQTLNCVILRLICGIAPSPGIRCILAHPNLVLISYPKPGVRKCAWKHPRYMLSLVILMFRMLLVDFIRIFHMSYHSDFQVGRTRPLTSTSPVGSPICELVYWVVRSVLCTFCQSAKPSSIRRW